MNIRTIKRTIGFAQFNFYMKHTYTRELLYPFAVRRLAKSRSCEEFSNGSPRDGLAIVKNILREAVVDSRNGVTDSDTVILSTELRGKYFRNIEPSLKKLASELARHRSRHSIKIIVRSSTNTWAAELERSLRRINRLAGEEIIQYKIGYPVAYPFDLVVSGAMYRLETDPKRASAVASFNKRKTSDYLRGRFAAAWN